MKFFERIAKVMAKTEIVSGNGEISVDSGSVERPTAAYLVTGYPVSSAPTASRTGELRRATANLRDRTELLDHDATELHHGVQSYDLDERTSLKARSGVEALLRELTEVRGMAWADIARIAQVSVSAVKKWRAGGAATPERRAVLARLAAFLDLLAEFAIDEPAQWLEVPMITPRFTVTPLDVYLRGGDTLLLDWAGNWLTTEQVLDRFDSNWREHYHSEFEVFTAPDGLAALRPASR